MEVFQQTPIPAEGKDHAFPCAFGISHISFFNDAHKPSSGELPPKITTLSRLNSLLLDTGRRDLSNGAVGTGYFSESCLVSWAECLNDTAHRQPGRDRPTVPRSAETGGQPGSSRPQTCRARTVAWATEPASCKAGPPRRRS